MFKKNRMSQDAANFYNTQYKFVAVTATRYLYAWFEQIFSTPSYRDTFKGWDNVAEQMAVACVSYLLGGLESKNQDINYKRAEKSASKWADDVMCRDKDFRELIVQTARMDYMFQSYFDGVEEYKKKPGSNNIISTIKKYGDKVPSSPSPKTYSKLLKEWLKWVEVMNKNGN